MESVIGLVFVNLIYEGLYNDYQVMINLIYDIYVVYFVNNVSGFVINLFIYGYNDGWFKRCWEYFYDNCIVEEYSQLIKIFWFCGKECYYNVFYMICIYYVFLIFM